MRRVRTFFGAEPDSFEDATRFGVKAGARHVVRKTGRGTAAAFASVSRKMRAYNSGVGGVGGVR